MNKDFNKWNSLKQRIDQKEVIRFKQGEIYFMSIGQNIGHEAYGKNDLYLRPVLVYRKLSKQTFIGIPLSSKQKNGTYFYTFRYTEKTLSTALLNQIRVFDIKRSEYYDGHINLSDFGKLKNKLLSLLDVTPNPKGKGSEHSSKKLPKYNSSISDKIFNVKSDANVPNILKQDGVMSSIFDMANQGITHIPDLIKKYGKENSWSHTLVDTESNSATLICQLPNEGNRRHYHPDWNEWWFIIDGTWQWNIKDEIKIINKGDLVFMPKGVKHKITAIGDKCAIRIAVSRYDVAHVYDKEDY
jgi:quercetin dioxygenase-like cupin family protein/mRNA-degrading endonuclease toxin of MazEF toxin-antitoxin module